MDQHEGFFVGIFTAMLVLATILLWRSTNKLWDAGERQLEHVRGEASRQANDTRESIRIASDSAKATVAAADAARKTLESDRAWITWDTITMGQFKNSKVGEVFLQDAYGFSAVWKNTGRSPAENVTCTNLFRLIDPGSSPPYFEVRASDKTTQESSRGVGAEISGFLHPMSDDESADFRARKRNVLFYSRVTYNDVFNRGVERTSEACLEIEFAGGQVIRGDRESAPISFHLVGTQNGIS